LSDGQQWAPLAQDESLRFFHPMGEPGTFR
jgi:hypothetical protein